mgnify:CR=1 FL=1
MINLMNQNSGPGQQALRKGRHSTPGGIYLVTAVTEQRTPWFQEQDLATLTAQSIAGADDRYGTRTFCWVVMPDHFHWLVQTGKLPLEQTVNRLKGASARGLNAKIGRKGRFWAPGFHDRALRREEDLKRVARYVVGNPLRAGLVSQIGDYPFWDAVWL